MSNKFPINWFIMDNKEWINFIKKDKKNFKKRSLKEFDQTSKEFEKNLKSWIKYENCNDNELYMLITNDNNELIFVMEIIFNENDIIPSKSKKLHIIKGKSVRFEGIYVYKDYRGKGVCKMAIKIASDWIKKNTNFKYIYIHNVSIKNKSARKCYESNGFRRIKLYTHPEYGRSISMIKNIS